MKSKNAHWDNIFSNSENSKLGWYESDTSATFQLLNQIKRLEEKTVFIPGAGTSTLVEDLIPLAKQLVLNDVSNEALNILKKRIENTSSNIIWNCQDITVPFDKHFPKVDIWIDRAVLHFLTNKEDIKKYISNIKSNLNKNGYVIFAEFSKVGVAQCAGLDVQRYSKDELSQNLGDSFELLYHFDFIYTNPNGDKRPYIYTLYKKIS